MQSERVPKHIGIIMDGNRRFAKRLMLKPWKGHEWGAKKVESILTWCQDHGIKELTLYAFSEYNFDRPKEEFNFLMDLFRKEFDRLMADERLERENIRINIIGRLWKFPEDVQAKMKQIMEQTKDNNDYILNFAMGYSGRGEVIDAAKKIAEEVQNGTLTIDDINDEIFGKHLYFNDEVDLIIRTSGETRTSDFLPWQGSNAEWIFVEKHWPELEKEDFDECIAEYARRERRFGK